MTHPALIKASKLARVAKENGWHGSLESEVIGSHRITTLEATRNDEIIIARWGNNNLHSAGYSFCYEDQDHTLKMVCAKGISDRLSGWPDLEDLFKWFPNANRPLLVEKYRRLPFNWREDDDEKILSNLIGRQIFWYSRMSSRLASDVVLEPKVLKGKKLKHFEIRHINGQKMFNFVGKEAGFRSVLLDTLVKVA